MTHPVPQGANSANSTVLGSVAFVAGAGWLLASAGVGGIGLPVVLSAALIALGVSLALTARRATSGWLIALGVGLTFFIAASTTAINLDSGVLRSGVGDRAFAPLSAVEVPEQYALAVGELTIDLGELALAPDAATTTVTAKVGVGELHVIVPADVALSVEASAGAGEIVVLNTHRGDGLNESVSYRDEGYDRAERRLRLKLSVGTGHIEVRRAPR